MFAVIAMIMACYLVVHLASWGADSKQPNNTDVATEIKKTQNGMRDLNQICLSFASEYGLPFAQYSISSLYTLYQRFTFLNVAVFFLKYVPSGFYTCKSLKYFFVHTRERIRQKQTELEDIQLQAKIMNEKLCVHDSVFAERAERLRRGTERLREVRSRVRGLIAADETLRRLMDDAASWPDTDTGLCIEASPEEEGELIKTLLKDFKGEPGALAERMSDKMDCGEHGTTEASEDSVYSSIDDPDAKQEYRVQIVKVTNVYKVAYLKQYIKQKRLRRATRQAVLKKKTDSLAKILEAWQKSLRLEASNNLDVASQDAMGDYSKPKVPESDSDSGFMKSTDAYFDEYSLTWSQGPYRNYGYNFEEVADAAGAKEFYEAQEYNELNYTQRTNACECSPSSNVLFVLPEETSSQMEIEEIRDEAADYESECRDVIAI